MFMLWSSVSAAQVQPYQGKTVTAEAKRKDYDISPKGGAEFEALARRVMTQSPEIVEQEHDESVNVRFNGKTRTEKTLA